MVGNQIELKFNSLLAHAFSVLKLATQAGPKSPPLIVILIHSKELLEDYFSLLQTLINADGHAVSLHQWQAWEHPPFSPVASSITQKIDRLKTLYSITGAKTPTIVLATVEAWIQPTVPKENYQSNHLVLELNQDVGSREQLRERLQALGYLKADVVDEPGQYAVRGEILDLFIPHAPAPYRIEFFDTVVEAIRTFHPETQRTQSSNEPIRSLEITPAEEILFPWKDFSVVLERVKAYSDQRQISRKIRDPIFENIRNGFLPDHFRTWIPFIHEKCGALLDYLPEHTSLITFEPEQLKIELTQTLDYLKKEEVRYSQPHWITPDFSQLYSRAEALLAQAIQSSRFIIRNAPLSDRALAPIPSEPVSELRLDEKAVYEWLEDGFFVWIGSRGISHQERLKFILKRVLSKPGLKFLADDPRESLQFLTEKTIILSEDLFLGKSQAAVKKKSTPHVFPKTEGLPSEELTHLSDLSIGDFVVHATHGVGKYVALQELQSQGRNLGEYLLIEYSGGDRLFLPVYRLNTIQRYVGAGGNPSLDKLGTAQFEKAKQKARDSARKLAINLIEIYAKRELLKGVPFAPEDQSYFDFVDEFEFQETEGQLKATQDTLHDLESGKLLDRLVCGDVGFGKTEVAMRAAFQAVQSGYQVALLVPTTLLAFQHEQSFRRRFKNFPVQIESISRFKSKKMQQEVLKSLAEGKIDILVGTHRLISKDVEWNKLGLLIIDEEHRFGVEHKEKIKAVQANTHTLTLTATPIPRTLNMAISGLKDISLIKTPPTNRQPIKTFVSHDSEELIKSALENELARGGQVFYLYNRVASIFKKAEELQKLVPQAKIIVAHGQMKEDEIESKMIEFYQGQAQILVCTTIIESGIDVPNAGTIIIQNADRLGLAQLYQIRGRVGRSHRKAFAYLLVDEERTLTQEAKMRLDVLQRFIELGSGFQIASYDLEIRGGGNFLGAEQSGHIASVGLDLFTELLEEAVQELRGQKIDIDERHFEPEIQVPVTCEISPKLIEDPKMRLSFYRKLSNARTDAQLDSLHEELVDRFGELPEEVTNLFWLIRIKNLLKRVGVEQLSTSPVRSSLTVRKTTLIDVNEVMKLYTGPPKIRDPRVSITPDSKIVLQAPFQSMQSLLFELEGFFKKIAPKAFETIENPKSTDRLSL